MPFPADEVSKHHLECPLYDEPRCRQKSCPYSSRRCSTVSASENTFLQSVVAHENILFIRGLRCIVHPYDMGPAHSTPEAQPVERPHVMDIYPNVCRSHNGKQDSECREHVFEGMLQFSLQHIGVNYTRIIKAFIIYRSEPGGPAAFFNELSEFTQIFGSTLYIAQTIIGDSVVVCLGKSPLPAHMGA